MLFGNSGTWFWRLLWDHATTFPLKMQLFACPCTHLLVESSFCACKPQSSTSLTNGRTNRSTHNSSHTSVAAQHSTMLHASQASLSLPRVRESHPSTAHLVCSINICDFLLCTYFTGRLLTIFSSTCTARGLSRRSANKFRHISIFVSITFSFSRVCPACQSLAR